jgi:hypothetical protein
MFNTRRYNTALILQAVARSSHARERLESAATPREADGPSDVGAGLKRKTSSGREQKGRREEGDAGIG